MSSWKRGFLEIIAEILDSLMASSLKKTHVTFKCNLDSRAVTKYLSIMIDVGLVEKSTSDHSLFVITQKGVKYRNHFNSFMVMMEEDLSKLSNQNSISKELIQNIKVRTRS